MSFSFFLLVVLSGCQRDAIEVYTAPKEAAPAMPSMASSASPGVPSAPSHASETRWTAPASWTVQPASGMRAASFLYKGRNGQPVDISVVPLAGEAGGDLSNVNRWRGQLQLPPISEQELNAQAENIKAGKNPMRIVEFVSDQPLIENRYKQRMVAAIAPHEGETLFVKMMGEDAAVREAKPSFRQFLNSIRFHDHD